MNNQTDAFYIENKENEEMEIPNEHDNMIVNLCNYTKSKNVHYLKPAGLPRLTGLGSFSGIIGMNRLNNAKYNCSSNASLYKAIQNQDDNKNNPERVSNFHSALTKLSKKYCNSQDQFSKDLVSSRALKEIKKLDNIMKSSSNIEDRLLKEGEKMKIRKEIKKKKYESQSTIECTFQPRIDNSMKSCKGGNGNSESDHLNNTNFSNFSKRSLSQFYEDQKNFLVRKHESIKKAEEELERKSMSLILDKPCINHYSKRKSNINESAFNRLYQNCKNKTEKKYETNTFVPSIDESSKKLIRKERIDKILYDDAIKRQNKDQNDQNEIQKKDPELKSAKQYKLAEKKLERDFHIILENNLNNLNSAIINQDDFKIVLEELGFMNKINSDKEKALFDKLIDYIKNEDSLIEKKVALLALKAIMNFDITDFSLSNDEKNQAERLGNLRLHKHFYKFFINKLSNAMKNSKIVEIKLNLEQSNHQPIIFENSRKLSKISKEQLLVNVSNIECDKEIEESNSSPENLHIPKDKDFQNIQKVDSNSIEIFRQRIKEQKIRKQTVISQKQVEKECTFKPKINERPRSNINIQRKENFPLSNTSKIIPITVNTIIQKKLGQELDDKNMKDCTFKPMINGSLKNSKKGPKIAPRKVESVIQRMQKARKEKERIINKLMRLQGQTILFTEVASLKFKSAFKDQKSNNPKPSFGKIEKLPEPKLNSTLSLVKLKDDNVSFLQKSTSQVSMNNYEEKEPLLCIDVNLEKGKVDQIVYYEGDSSEKLARDFSLKNGTIN